MDHVKSGIAGKKAKLELPTDIGDVYALYVAAAAAIAYYSLIAEGQIDASEIPALVNESALQMVRLLMLRSKAKPVRPAGGSGSGVPAGNVEAAVPTRKRKGQPKTH